MDSAGIGMIIGRYKMIKMLGGELEIENATRNVRKVLEMSGITKIISLIICIRFINKKSNADHYNNGKNYNNNFFHINLHSSKFMF